MDSQTSSPDPMGVLTFKVRHEGRLHTHIPGGSMKTLVSTLLVALSLLAVSACDSGDDLPSQGDLVGLWVNEDAGTTRAFEFVASVSAAEDPALSAKPFVYTLYFYPTGSAPVVAQRGHYRITDGHLVTDVVAAPIDPSLAGTSFANVIKGFSRSALTLESTSSASGKRVFVHADSL